MGNPSFGTWIQSLGFIQDAYSMPNPQEIRKRPAFWPKSSWGRFQEYAFLVHEIVLDPFVGTVDTPLRSKAWQDDFWCRLSSIVGNAPILPNLRAASLLAAIPFKHRPFDTGVLRVLNPSIRELNVALPRAGTEEAVKVRTALSECLSSFQNLEVLSIEMPLPPPDLGSLVQSHPHLHYLRLDNNFRVNSDHLTHLAALRRLEYLSVDLDPTAPLNVPVAFARLRILSVHSNEFDAICALVAYMAAPRLQTLFISESHLYSSKMCTEMQTILRTVVGKCPFLTAFQWESRHHHRRTDAALAELIDPLLSHPTLRSFSARFDDLIVRYTPADFRAMAEAWPDLETFHLHDGGWRHTNQYANLESVLAFARGCPRLRSLHIPDVEFDLDSIQAAVKGSQGSTAPHGLRDLRVTRSVGCLEQPEDSEEDAEGLRAEASRLFCRWVLGNVFPFAMIHVPC